MQILTLDGHNKETFRQEGDAEILELEEGETSGSSAERGMQTIQSTVLQKHSKCEVKAAWCGFYNLHATQILREIKSFGT